MNFQEYQEKAKRTRNTALTFKEQINNAALGLNGEAGEVADLIKKHLYQGHELDTTKLVKEMGDCLWYIALMCEELQIPMGVVALHNIQKLEKRYPAGYSADASINRKE